MMIRIYQVPICFYDSSEFEQKDHQGSFIVLIFEKIISKREHVPKKLDFVSANENREKRQLKLYNELQTAKKKRLLKSRHAFADIDLRESKVLRYANFWRSLFDVKKLQPFT